MAPPRTLLTASALAATALAGCGGQAPDPAAVCPGPVPPATVLADGERRAPDLAVGRDGTAAVAWETATGDPVEAAVRRDGRWGPAVPVAEPYAARARVAVLADGTAVVVWDGRDATGARAARAAVLPPDGAWAAPVDLGTSEGDLPPLPEVAAVPGGGAVAAWAGTTGRGPLLARLGPDGAWRAEDAVRATGRVLEVGVGAANGLTLLVWLEGRGGARVVRAATRRAGQGWSAATDLSASTGRANDPRVAVAADGGAVVAWRRDTSGGRQVVEAAVRSPRGAWLTQALGPETTRPRGLDRPPGPYPLGPRVAIGPGGRAVAAWPVRGDARDRVVRAAHAGGAWTSPADVSSSDESGGPDVALAPGGDAPVVWEDRDGVRLSLRLGEPGRRARVLTAEGQEAAAPRIARDGGGWLVAWNGTNRGTIAVTEARPCNG